MEGNQKTSRPITTSDTFSLKWLFARLAGERGAWLWLMVDYPSLSLSKPSQPFPFIDNNKEARGNSANQCTRRHKQRQAKIIE